MTDKIDERTEKVLRKFMPEDYDLKQAVWALKRKNKQGKKYIVAWIAKHKALEVAAAHNNIEFDMPTIIDVDVKGKSAVICVKGKMGDKSEWSFGESATYNTKNEYPFAMAEKRAKDRVILKLLGLHGDLYSEEEADEFKESKPDEDLEKIKQEELQEFLDQYDKQTKGKDPKNYYDDSLTAINGINELRLLEKTWDKINAWRPFMKNNNYITPEQSQDLLDAYNNGKKEFENA